jgi:hypothetical protein
VAQRIFISYQRADSRHPAGRLWDHLSRTFGDENVFLDVESVEGGIDFRDELLRHVADADAVLIVIGESFDFTRLHHPDDYTRLELLTALRLRKSVLPVLVDSAEMPSATELPTPLVEIAYRQGMRLRSGSDFRSDAQDLISTLESLPRSLHDDGWQLTTPMSGTPVTGTQDEPQPPDAAELQPLLARFLLDGRVIAVVGAGLKSYGRSSSYSWTPGDEHPPTFPELASHLGAKPASSLAEASLDGLNKVVDQIIRTRGKSVAYSALCELLQPAWAPNPVHTLLAQVPSVLRDHSPNSSRPFVIFSLDLDDQLECAFREAGEPHATFALIGAGEHRGRFLYRDAVGTEEVVITPNHWMPDAEHPVVVRMLGGIDRSDPSRSSFIVAGADWTLLATDLVRTLPVGIAAQLRRSHCLYLGVNPLPRQVQVMLDTWSGGQRLDYVNFAVQSLPDEVVEAEWRARSVRFVSTDVLALMSGLIDTMRGGVSS